MSTASIVSDALMASQAVLAEDSDGLAGIFAYFGTKDDEYRVKVGRALGEYCTKGRLCYWGRGTTKWM